MRRVRLRLLIFAVFFAAGFAIPPAMARGVYLTPQEFLQQSLGSSDHVSQALWLEEVDKLRAREIFKREYPGFRVRYWQEGETTAWIFDEIGKTRPITFGVVVEGKQIKNIRVLEFRESRGSEIRHPFFTQQFIGLSLKGQSGGLSQSVDGITGATLSVRAAIRVARFALYLSGRTAPNQQVAMDD